MKPYKELLFRNIPSGLYFHYISDRGVVLVNTVFKIREGFYQRQYYGANQAQCALAMVGYPSEKYFKNMVCAGMVTKFPVTLDEIKNSITIFGTNAS